VPGVRISDGSPNQKEPLQRGLQGLFTLSFITFWAETTMITYFYSIRFKVLCYTTKKDGSLFCVYHLYTTSYSALFGDHKIHFKIYQRRGYRIFCWPLAV
jgi:hypothetical protein